MNIGFGEGGTKARQYYVRDGTFDVGFLKLFVSTKYVDFSDVAQQSPFNEARADKEYKPEGPELWHAIVIPVIQKNGPFELHEKRVIERQRWCESQIMRFLCRLVCGQKF